MGGRKLKRLPLEKRKKKDPYHKMKRVLHDAKLEIEHKSFWDGFFSRPDFPETSGMTCRFRRADK